MKVQGQGGGHVSAAHCIHRAPVQYTNKKWNKIFLKYKESQSGAVAKSYMRKYLVIYSMMTCEAASHIWLSNRSTLDFLLYEEIFLFFFISVENNIAV